jgi:hypothetical protein
LWPGYSLFALLLCCSCLCFHIRLSGKRLFGTLQIFPPNKRDLLPDHWPGFLRKVLRYYSISDSHIAITILLLGLGTNLLCYSSQSATMSHAYNFCLFSIFIHYTIRWHEKHSAKNTIIIGLLLGLITLIRPSNAIIFLFFILYNVSSWSAFKERMLFLKRECFLLNVIAFLAIIVWVPQFLYWKEVTGNYLFYSYTDEGFFSTGHISSKGFSVSAKDGWYIHL